MKKISIVLLLIIYTSIAHGQTKRQIQNLIAFSKVYGYVQYFHPSEEAAKIDWLKLAAYGTSCVLNCKTDIQLKDALVRIFRPIAPTAQFYRNLDEMEKYRVDLLPINDGYKIVYWQHFGLGLHNQIKKNVYKSVRVNPYLNDKLFEHDPSKYATIFDTLSNSIICRVPMVLYRDSTWTYPKGDLQSNKDLKNKLASITESCSNLSVRLSNVIRIFNIIQHFYPYKKEAPINWELETRKALRQAFKDKTRKEHIISLEKYTAKLNDGHVWIGGYNRGSYLPPLSLQFLQNRLIVTKLYDNNTGLNLGDEIVRVNGMSIADFYKQRASRVSAATNQLRRKRTIQLFLNGYSNSAIQLETKNKKVTINRTQHYTNSIRKDTIMHRQYADGIFYLNLNEIAMDSIVKLMPKLKEQKAIICDLRRYPNNNSGFLSFLIKKDDTASNWMETPEIIEPNYSNVKISNSGWKLPAAKPYLGDKHIIFLVSGRCVSYCESIMLLVEHYKMGVIVGEATAGTNGNMNPIKLLDGLNFCFTGMKVTKLNGSQFHGVGVLPNYKVNRTMEGVQIGRDEVLEFAIELAQKKLR